LKFRVPLSEIITDFFDFLKSISRGYGSMDYEIVDYEVNNLLKDW
jgi:GTP-binding protein LepA